MICEYCKNEFKNSKSMHHHQRKTKYCLDIQKKSKNIIEYKCAGCYKLFYDKNCFNSHNKLCLDVLIHTIDELNKKVKELEHENKMSEDNVQYFQNECNILKQHLLEKDKAVKEYQEQIKVLQEHLVSVTKTAVLKPTTVNNNNKILNMSILNLNEIDIKNIIKDKYIKDMIYDGQKGVAKFATEFILKDSDGNLTYSCTDLSRKVFKYKNESGELEKDINAKKLTMILSGNGLFEKTTELSREYWTNEDGSLDNDKFNALFSKASEIYYMKEDNTIFRNELANMTCI